MNLQHLRTATRPEHEATEAAVPLLGPGLTRERYVDVLLHLYPVLRSWETWSALHAPPRLLPLLPPRRRSPWLQADLAALSAKADTSIEPPPISWVSAILLPGETLERATEGELEAGFLGALYVLEGSTLGGRFLAKQVEMSLNLSPGHGNAYFQGHGEATGALWREVTAEVAGVPEERAERLIGAASRTFGLFREALQRPASSETLEAVTAGAEPAHDQPSRRGTPGNAPTTRTPRQEEASKVS